MILVGFFDHLKTLMGLVFILQTTMGPLQMCLSIDGLPSRITSRSSSHFRDRFIYQTLLRIAELEYPVPWLCHAVRNESLCFARGNSNYVTGISDQKPKQ